MHVHIAILHGKETLYWIGTTWLKVMSKNIYTKF